MAEGNGTLRMTDGTVYIGEFVRGKEEGKGVLTTKGGVRFEGSFKKDKRTVRLWKG